MITILDYGLGNISAFANIYKRNGIQFKIAKTSTDLKDAQRIILPGVGSFDWAMQSLSNSGMREILEKLVLEDGVPVLGVCVGMQIMADTSEEGKMPGLGWIPGQVKKFNDSQIDRKVILPHMGWNYVSPIDHPLFADIV